MAGIRGGSMPGSHGQLVYSAGLENTAEKNRPIYLFALVRAWDETLPKCSIAGSVGSYRGIRGEVAWAAQRCDLKWGLEPFPHPEAA